MLPIELRIKYTAIQCIQGEFSMKIEKYVYKSWKE